MSTVDGLYARWRKIFESDENTRAANFYCFWNEVPILLLIIMATLGRSLSRREESS
jgi:uncharacterized membrane protein